MMFVALCQFPESLGMAKGLKFVRGYTSEEASADGDANIGELVRDSVYNAERWGT